MHDLDRTLGNTHMESDSFFEFEADHEADGNGEYGEAEDFIFQSEQEAFEEAEVNELAAELLSVSNQQELNHFLGDLIKKAGGAIGKVVNSPLGQQLGGLLKTAAKTALPLAGSAIGNAIAPGIGGAIGGKLGSAASSMFGLELEGLSPEDRQFEVAKQFVRFGGDATKQALALADQGKPPAAAASSAVSQAADRYLPGLAQQKGAATNGHSRAKFPHRGSWERHGNKLVIHLSRA